MRHFLRDDDLTPQEYAHILDLAAKMKAAPYAFVPLAGPQPIAMVFDKPTLRTQVTFSAGISALGGAPVAVDGFMARIGERESIEDSAKVLGRVVSAIVWRTGPQSNVDEMAAHAGVPVINALTDDFHPCQGLADLLTIKEHQGDLVGKTLAFLGDTGCNMAHTYALAGALSGMHVRLAGPEEYSPDLGVLARAQEIARETGGSVSFSVDAAEAARAADAIATDTWVSMGKEEESADRLNVLAPYQLNRQLLELGQPGAIALHCLPAYRGKEITAEVIDGPQSVVFDEAENRLHVQKAILAWLLDPRVRSEIR